MLLRRAPKPETIPDGKAARDVKNVTEGVILSGITELFPKRSDPAFLMTAGMQLSSLKLKFSGASE